MYLLNQSINCNNMLCNESVHINCITKFHDDIVLAAITASDVIPETVKKSNNFPGWTKETSYLRDIMRRYSYSVWLPGFGYQCLLSTCLIRSIW